MSRVEKAIETGRCALAVSGALLRDPEVMLALTQRASLTPMALAGPAVSPVVPVGPEGIARAVAEPGGVVVLVEPESADAQGLKTLGDLLQRGRHRPDIVVVARQYNPFAFGGALTGLRIDHEKGRGKSFLQGLPEASAIAVDSAPDAAEVDGSSRGDGRRSAKAPRPGSDIAAPRYVFAGREEDLAALGGMLAEGGPIVVSGPDGVGRTQLVEHAIKASGLTRLPDVWLGWGSGFDTFVARIATVAAEAGDVRLTALLHGEHLPADAARLAAEVLSAPVLSGRVLVVHGLEHALGRDGDFFRKSRLEILVYALLTGKSSLPIVFVSTRTPVFHRESEAPHLRKIELEGVKGRFLHEIFEANKAIEMPREKFGPIHERIHGHPFAARTFAVATRTRQDGADLADDPKFLKMDSVSDVEPIRKHLARRVEKLPKALRLLLAVLAHTRVPMDGTMLQDLGVNRKDRLELLSLGLLDQVGTEDDRRYRVHPLVKAQLSWREVSDFDISARMAELYGAQASKAQGAARLALEQEQNRFAVASRALRLRARTDLPDHDMWLESIAGMLRAKMPRLDLVDQRLAETLHQNPHNADAWLLRLELAQVAGEAKPEIVEQLLEEAMARAPIPELLHQVAGWAVRRNRNRAIAVLERGIAAFPNESRLRTRLAGLLLRQGRRNEAIEHLRLAMELEPMLPDAYGLLGQARRDEGAQSLGEAETLLREAVRLAPNDPIQLGRLVDLLLERARADLEKMGPLRAEAHTLLDDALKGDRRAPEACLLAATLIREEGGDLERAGWLLGQAKKLTDRGHERMRRIVVERALLDLTRGDLDAAELALRGHIAKDPSHARAFAALGHVLEAREQFIPAHAELLRAKERTAQNSLEHEFYDQQLRRIQGIIEAQAAGLWAKPETERYVPPTPPVPSNRVLRRRGSAESAAEAAAETGDGPSEPSDGPTEPNEEPLPSGEPASPGDETVAPEPSQFAEEDPEV
jgi:tetratricopeptide (TPR) repeat protein